MNPILRVFLSTLELNLEENVETPLLVHLLPQWWPSGVPAWQPGQGPLPDLLYWSRISRSFLELSGVVIDINLSLPLKTGSFIAESKNPIGSPENALLKTSGTCGEIILEDKPSGEAVVIVVMALGSLSKSIIESFARKHDTAPI